MTEALRDKYRALRNAIPPERRAYLATQATEALEGHELWRGAKRVLLFRSVGSEMDTSALIGQAFAQGKAVYLPGCVDTAARLMQAFRIAHPLDTSPGAYGIPEPCDRSCPQDPASLDLILAPGLCFDAFGGRIGYGAGYYDRYLKRARRGAALVGWGFEEQLHPGALALGANDVRLGALCTQCGVRVFADWRGV